MQFTGVYSAYMNAVSVSTAITIVQVKAGSSRSLALLRAWCTQSNLTTSSQQRIQVLRKTAAATVTSFTPIKLAGGAPTADAAGGTSATGTNASGEGTDGDVLIPDTFNILNGWLWVPTPEERIVVPAAGIVALKFPAAPGAALTVTAGFIFGELG